jgi:hypothetical protein
MTYAETMEVVKSGRRRVLESHSDAAVGFPPWDIHTFDTAAGVPNQRATEAALDSLVIFSE